MNEEMPSSAEEGTRPVRIEDGLAALGMAVLALITFANVILYILLTLRPPRKIFDVLLKRVRAFSEPQSSHPILIRLVRIPWLIKQGFRHLRFGEFSVITGRTGFLLWRIGALKLWLKLAVRKLELPQLPEPRALSPEP